MKNQVSVISLGIQDIARSRHFYVAGFGFTPIFENEDIVFYRLNGVVLATFLQPLMEADMQRFDLSRRSAFALTHSLDVKELVQPLLERLAASGGQIMRNGSEPSYGGFRGYACDPDGHAWEVSWHPAWTFDEHGLVSMGF